MTSQNLIEQFLTLPETDHDNVIVVSPATSKVEITGDRVNVELKDIAGQNDLDMTARERIREAGLDPDSYVISSMRKSNWTMANGEPGESIRYTFAKVAHNPALELDSDLYDLVGQYPMHINQHIRDTDSSAFVVLIGDMQVGKMESHGSEIGATLSLLQDAYSQYRNYIHDGYRFNHVHIAWLGDHIEGFESQGGKNAWRTPMSLTAQLRVVRRMMMYAIELFAPETDRLTVAAVPGNHGRVTAQGGITQFNDNFDTDCLVAVADACAQNPAAFGHVEFYVPESDEMTVICDVAGTMIAHAHGHQWSANKYFDWWQGQSFGGRLAGCDMLVAGHLHHFKVDTWGPQMFIQVPSLESESTWYKHRTGTPGNPGIVTFITSNKTVENINVLRLPDGE